MHPARRLIQRQVRQLFGGERVLIPGDTRALSGQVLDKEAELASERPMQSYLPESPPCRLDP